MRVELQAGHDGWAHLTTEQLGAALPLHVDIGDIPSLPLARTLDMPPQAGFARGDLGLGISAVRVTLDAKAALRVEQVSVEPDRCTVELRVSGLSLCGTQQVQGTQIWESGIDGAGNGLRWGESLRGGADDDPVTHPTWIATANEQRAALQDVPNGNGAALLSTYSTHRAAFTDAFTLPISTAFQNGWAVDAVTEMAQDTNDNVNGNNVINCPTKQYGGTTYNGNAQTQKLALITALTGMAKHANPQHPQDPTNPYNQAAASTLTFSSTVLQNTGVDKLPDVPPKTTQDVYSLVAAGTPAAAVSVADVHTLLSGNPIGGRDSQGNVWTMVLSEDERVFVRQLQAEQAEHSARLANARPVSLVQGEVTATLDCFVSLHFAKDGGLRLLDGRVELDGFDLDFDDSRWEALLGTELAETARAALEQARFIKSLVHDRVADALERALVPALSGVLLGAR